MSWVRVPPGTQLNKFPLTQQMLVRGISFVINKKQLVKYIKNRNVKFQNFSNWKKIFLQLGKNIFLTGENYFCNWAFLEV